MMLPIRRAARRIVTGLVVPGLVACSTSATETQVMTGEFRVRIDSAERSSRSDTVALYITDGA